MKQDFNIQSGTFTEHVKPMAHVPEEHQFALASYKSIIRDVALVTYKLISKICKLFIGLRFATASFNIEKYTSLHWYDIYALLCNSNKGKVREKARECHKHKPQPIPDTKRKRKQTKPNKCKSNKRT